MPERAALLLQLLDADVLAILKARLSAEQRADLIEEIINPHRKLTSQQIAALAGVARRTAQRRIGEKNAGQ